MGWETVPVESRKSLILAVRTGGMDAGFSWMVTLTVREGVDAMGWSCVFFDAPGIYFNPILNIFLSINSFLLLFLSLHLK